MIKYLLSLFRYTQLNFHRPGPMHADEEFSLLTCNKTEFIMKKDDCVNIVVHPGSAAEGLAQRVVEVLSASKDSLQKVSEVKISVNPVVVYSVDLTFIP